MSKYECQKFIFCFEGFLLLFKDSCSDTLGPFVGAPEVTPSVTQKCLEGANLPHEKEQQRVTPAFICLHRFVHTDTR